MTSRVKSCDATPPGHLHRFACDRIGVSPRWAAAYTQPAPMHGKSCERAVCIRRLWEASVKLPRAVIASCVRRIEVDCGFTMPLWEKCLRCGEKLGDCTCPGALEPCIACGETFAACACE